MARAEEPNPFRDFHRRQKIAALVKAAEAFAEHSRKTLAELLPTLEAWTAGDWATLAAAARLPNGKPVNAPSMDRSVPAILVELRQLAGDFVVEFDDARLVRVRPHRWAEGNLVRVSGYDRAYFSNRRIADEFARGRTFRGAPARAVPT